MMCFKKKRMMSLSSSKFLPKKKKLFINIKQMKSCQLFTSFNIPAGLVPIKRKTMTQNNGEAGQALSLPLIHDCIPPSQLSANIT